MAILHIYHIFDIIVVGCCGVIPNSKSSGRVHSAEKQDTITAKYLHGIIQSLLSTFDHGFRGCFTHDRRIIHGSNSSSAASPYSPSPAPSSKTLPPHHLNCNVFQKWTKERSRNFWWPPSSTLHGATTENAEL